VAVVRGEQVARVSGPASAARFQVADRHGEQARVVEQRRQETCHHPSCRARKNTLADQRVPGRTAQPSGMARLRSRSHR